VTASVSLVFLLTLTTPPNRFIKAVSFFIPGAFKSIISISYRYIFFLTRKIEEFIMGFRARNISSLVTRHSSLIGQRWTASRIGLLFSMSIRLSAEL
jgi:energy-coupling factor transporter transmembrane protein EcfT